MRRSVSSEKPESRPGRRNKRRSGLIGTRLMRRLKPSSRRETRRPELDSRPTERKEKPSSRSGDSKGRRKLRKNVQRLRSAGKKPSRRLSLPEPKETRDTRNSRRRPRRRLLSDRKRLSLEHWSTKSVLRRREPRLRLVESKPRRIWRQDSWNLRLRWNASKPKERPGPRSLT